MPKKSSRDEFEPKSSSHKKAKIYAQRKFAEGFSSNLGNKYVNSGNRNNNSNTGVNTKKASKLPDAFTKCPITIPSLADAPGPFDEVPKPTVEDFIDFLCFRGTERLPERLNYLNYPPEVLQKKKNTKEKEYDEALSMPPPPTPPPLTSKRRASRFEQQRSQQSIGSASPSLTSLEKSSPSLQKSRFKSENHFPKQQKNESELAQQLSVTLKEPSFLKQQQESYSNKESPIVESSSLLGLETNDKSTAFVESSTKSAEKNTAVGKTKWRRKGVADEYLVPKNIFLEDEQRVQSTLHEGRTLRSRNRSSLTFEQCSIIPENRLSTGDCLNDLHNRGSSVSSIINELESPDSHVNKQSSKSNDNVNKVFMLDSIKNKLTNEPANQINSQETNNYSTYSNKKKSIVNINGVTVADSSRRDILEKFLIGVDKTEPEEEQGNQVTREMNNAVSLSKELNLDDLLNSKNDVTKSTLCVEENSTRELLPQQNEMKISIYDITVHTLDTAKTAPFDSKDRPVLKEDPIVKYSDTEIFDVSEFEKSECKSLTKLKELPFPKIKSNIDTKLSAKKKLNENKSDTDAMDKLFHSKTDTSVEKNVQNPAASRLSINDMQTTTKSMHSSKGKLSKKLITNFRKSKKFNFRNVLKRSCEIRKNHDSNDSKRGLFINKLKTDEDVVQLMKISDIINSNDKELQNETTTTTCDNSMHSSNEKLEKRRVIRKRKLGSTKPISPSHKSLETCINETEIANSDITVNQGESLKYLDVLNDVKVKSPTNSFEIELDVSDVHLQPENSSKIKYSEKFSPITKKKKLESLKNVQQFSNTIHESCVSNNCIKQNLSNVSAVKKFQKSANTRTSTIFKDYSLDKDNRSDDIGEDRSCRQRKISDCSPNNKCSTKLESFAETSSLALIQNKDNCVSYSSGTEKTSSQIERSKMLINTTEDSDVDSGETNAGNVANQLDESSDRITRKSTRIQRMCFSNVKTTTMESKTNISDKSITTTLTMTKKSDRQSPGTTSTSTFPDDTKSSRDGKMVNLVAEISSSLPTETVTTNNTVTAITTRRKNRMYNGVTSKKTVTVGSDDNGNRARIDGIMEAPTFYPNEKEFVDPMRYIESIQPIAEKFGICRIVPPSNFKPECKVIDEMRFMAYNQYVHKMLNRWGPNVKEMSAIKKYLLTQNIAFTRPPWIGGIEVDVPRLYQTVQQCGGLKEVIVKEKWQRVADLMKIPKSAQERLTKLDDVYCKYILPYDTLSEDERRKLLEQAEKDWRQFTKSRQINNKAYEEIGECVTKGRTMPLSSFYRIARNTMMMWFGNETEICPDVVEEEFWKHVSERKHHLCVNSGSIDSGPYGYGFPISKNSTCSKHPWNLKVLTNNTSSVIRSLGRIIGVTVPTLHVSMLFSACCWYRDPHGLPWIEYLHTGASKIWYGIANENSGIFKNAVLNLSPHYCHNKRVWLPSDSIMIPPLLLTEYNVPLSRVIQNPGQFIVVFPKSFTSSISTGYLVSESVYFAQTSWLRTAEEIFKDMHESCEPSAFSLQELLISIANDVRANISTLKEILPMLSNMRDSEVALRSQLDELGLRLSERLPVNKGKKSSKTYMNDGDNYECATCKANLFLSFVINSHQQSNYCLQHAVQFLYKKQNQVKYCKLFYSYNEEELEDLIVKVKERIDQKRPKK